MPRARLLFRGVAPAWPFDAPTPRAPLGLPPRAAAVVARFSRRPLLLPLLLLASCRSPSNTYTHSFDGGVRASAAKLAQLAPKARVHLLLVNHLARKRLTHGDRQ